MIEAKSEFKNLIDSMDNPARVRAAIAYLRLARDLLRAAKAEKSADRVNQALTSADGARRHAERVRTSTPSRGKHALRIKDSRPESDPDT